MNTKNIKLWTILPCTARRAYEAWLNSKIHGEMVDGNAKIDPKVNGEFSVWDKTITGKTIEIDPKKRRIVQNWRYEYDNWPKENFSKLTVEFLPFENGQCKLRMRHSQLPAEFADEIESGWKDYYFTPMKKYFASSR